jgi:hypothetical protein
VLATAGAAAVLVLLGGIGAAVGVVHVHLSGHHSEAVLTGVNGCNQLEEADGTLLAVNGTTLVVQTTNGRSLAVTTTPSTFVSMSGPLLSDITDGASVMVHGYRADGTVRAAIVTVGLPFSAVSPAGYIAVQGTVAGSTTAGFTLMTPTGSPVRVTLSPSTLVVVPHASLGQLQPGTRIFAAGTASGDGTLSATAVGAVSQLRSGPHTRLSIKVRDCSPSSIVEAVGALSTAPPSAG